MFRTLQGSYRLISPSYRFHVHHSVTAFALGVGVVRDYFDDLFLLPPDSILYHLKFALQDSLRLAKPPSLVALSSILLGASYFPLVFLYTHRYTLYRYSVNYSTSCCLCVSYFYYRR